MDAFSEILSGVKLNGAVFFTAEFSAPWGFSAPASKITGGDDRSRGGPPRALPPGHRRRSGRRDAATDSPSNSSPEMSSSFRTGILTT